MAAKAKRARTLLSGRCGRSAGAVLWLGLLVGIAGTGRRRRAGDPHLASERGPGMRDAAASHGLSPEPQSHDRRAL